MRNSILPIRRIGLTRAVRCGRKECVRRGHSRNSCSTTMTRDAATFMKPGMNTSAQSSLPYLPLSDDGEPWKSRWLGFARRVSSWPKPVVVGLLLGLVFTVGLVDYLTGLELSVSLLYLVTIT